MENRAEACSCVAVVGVEDYECVVGEPVGQTPIALHSSYSEGTLAVEGQRKVRPLEYHTASYCTASGRKLLCRR